MTPAFRFQQFTIEQSQAVHPVGTDGVLLGAWACVDDVENMLDIGTGTGLIALMLAQRTTSARIDAVEINTASAQQADLNFQASPWASRLRLFQDSIQSFISSENKGKYDLIISNPPFFNTGKASPADDRASARHMLSLPLDTLLDCVAHLLSPDGKCCLILPAREAWLCCEMAVPKGLYWNKLFFVKSRPGKPVERMLITLSRDPLPFQTGKMCIYNETGTQYSIEYQQLTENFYLKNEVL